MPKTIVIFSDGTGNSAVKGRGTNVFKTFEAVDLNGHRLDASLTPQVAFYDDGVGTESFKILRAISGATGFGVTRNIRQLYREICRVYDPGDRLFFFGFSRGAFTVRSLVGFIATCGLVDPGKLRGQGRTTTRDLREAVKDAYAIYRADDRHRTLLGWIDRKPTLSKSEFRKQYCHEHPGREASDVYRVPIAFLGVWDTVDAVGMPFKISDLWNRVVYPFKFRDTKLSETVEYACQALAIDDERDSFQPLVWDVRGLPPARRACVEQVWFAGAHSNVGGGYPKQGMSLVALDWMMAKAEARGLRFVEADRLLAHDHASVDDKLYDPRAGAGIFYRWRPRDVAALSHDKGIDEPEVHVSVLERIARGTEDYAPGNIPTNAQVVITPVPGDGGLARARAEGVQQVLHDASRAVPGSSLLATVPNKLRAGYWSYWIYVGTCLAVVVGAAASEHLRSWVDGSASVVASTMRPSTVLQAPWIVVRGTVQLAFELVTSPIATTLATVRRILDVPILAWGLGGGFVVAFLLAGWVDRRMSARFSDFWHGVQPRLRDALKGARRAAMSETIVGDRGTGDNGAEVRGG